MIVINRRPIIIHVFFKIKIDEVTTQHHGAQLGTHYEVFDHYGNVVLSTTDYSEAREYYEEKLV